MHKSYVVSHKAAIKGKYWKNVDSSLYWLAVAYECEYEEFVDS